jgi:hypothetical protein
MYGYGRLVEEQGIPAMSAIFSSRKTGLGIRAKDRRIRRQPPEVDDLRTIVR